MSTRDQWNNHSQQARRRLLAALFVLTLLVVLLFVPGSAKEVRSAAAATNGASIWLDGPEQTTKGQTISYELTTDASGLYGVQLELAFDPAILQAASAQLTPGNCPAPNFTVINAIDNSAGTISYSAASLSPTPPCDGGIVASLQFQVSQTAAEGTTTVQFTEAIMADSDGAEIPVTTVDLNLEIVVTEADFKGSPLTGPAPLPVIFTDLSSGDYDTCTWDFGDSSGSNTCGNQSHTYTAPGTYTVSLSISGPSDSDSETKVDYIFVWEQRNLYLPVIVADNPQ